MSRWTVGRKGPYSRFVRSIAAALLLGSAALGCGAPAAFEERAVSPTRRVPLVAERVRIPGGAPASAVWVSPEGDGVIALRDGRLLAIDALGAVHQLDRAPGEAPREDEAQVFGFSERARGHPLALVPGGALAVERGLIHRSPLPPFLSAPRAFSPLGDEVLWATPDGIFASRAGKWFAVEAESGPLRDVTELVPIDGAPEAWVRAGSSLRRVRIDGGPLASPAVTWIEAAPGVDVGAVSGLAGVDGTRAVVTSTRGVAVIGGQRIRLYHAEPHDGLPGPLGGGGGFAWVGWADQILRTDGERWESLASGVSFGPGSRIAVDGGTGAMALIIDGSGGVIRIEAEATLRSSGLVDGETVRGTRIELMMIPPRGETVSSMVFTLDDKPLATRTRAPWGVGPDGARALELSDLPFGPHQIQVIAEERGGRTLRQRVRFTYTSPIGRVPTYARDIAPLYASHCARCHNNGIAHSLEGYDTLSAESAEVRAAIREARMPPDILLDPVSAAVFTAWADGNTPR